MIFFALLVATAAFSTSALADNAGYTFPPASTSAPNNHDGVVFEFAIGQLVGDANTLIGISHSANIRSSSGVIGSAKITHESSTAPGEQTRAIVAVTVPDTIYSNVLPSPYVRCTKSKTGFTCTTQPGHELNGSFKNGSRYAHIITRFSDGKFQFGIQNMKTDIFHLIAIADIKTSTGLGTNSFRNTFTYKGNVSCNLIKPFAYTIFPPISKKSGTVYRYNIERDASITFGPCPTTSYPYIAYAPGR